jgi:hypothetical protein
MSNLGAQPRPLQTSCAWEVIDVSDVGHDGKLMSAAAAPIVSAAMHESSS